MFLLASGFNYENMLKLRFSAQCPKEINSELKEALVLLKYASQFKKVARKARCVWYILCLSALGVKQITFSSVAEPCHSYNAMNNCVISTLNS